jgi:hypothetical protein
MDTVDEEGHAPPFNQSITSSSSGSLRLSKNQKNRCLASMSTYPVYTLAVKVSRAEEIRAQRATHATVVSQNPFTRVMRTPCFGNAG